MKKLLLLLVLILIPSYVLADFYVIPTGTRYKHPEVVGIYSDITYSGNTALTVPEGKTFILTDLDGNAREVSNSSVICELFENDDLKYPTFLILTGRAATGNYSTNYSKSFISGIPFTAGSIVHISVT